MKKVLKLVNQDNEDIYVILEDKKWGNDLE